MNNPRLSVSFLPSPSTSPILPLPSESDHLSSAPPYKAFSHLFSNPGLVKFTSTEDVSAEDWEGLLCKVRLEPPWTLCVLFCACPFDVKNVGVGAKLRCPPASWKYRDEAKELERLAMEHQKSLVTSKSRNFSLLLLFLIGALKKKRLAAFDGYRLGLIVFNSFTVSQTMVETGQSRHIMLYSWFEYL